MRASSTNVWPNPDCILRSAASFPWQDRSWRTPDFRDLIVYQLHIGTWYGPNRESRVANSSTSWIASISGGARRECHRAAADRRIQLPAQYGLQRLRPVLAGDGLSGLRAELDPYVNLANRLLAAKDKSRSREKY